MNWVARFERDTALKSALASVALSHPDDCDCLTCRAAHGDKKAFARIAEETFPAFPRKDS